MVALLNDVSVTEDQDHVGVLDGGKSVRDHEAGAIFHQGVHSLLNFDFCTGVNV